MNQSPCIPINIYNLIDEKEEIELICLEILEKEEFICVDLEFFPAKHEAGLEGGLKSKSEKKWEVSLVQINCPNLEKIFIFDIEAAVAKSKTNKREFLELKKLFESRKLVKVFHDHRQDFWAIHQTFDAELESVFDTQIADMFLSFSSSFRSYSTLVFETLNLKIDKACQNDDWSIRPLEHAQLEYAALDVIHLLPVFKKIQEKLENLGRSKWKAEYMNQIFEARKIQMHKVFQFFTKFNVCPKKSSFSFEKFEILKELIEIFENFPEIPINFLKNIFESKKISAKKLYGIFFEIKDEIKKTKEFKEFSSKILKIFEKFYENQEILAENPKEEAKEEERKIFEEIKRKIESSKIDLDFEFSHMFLILKFMLRKECSNQKISPQLVAEKHDLLEFLEIFQKKEENGEQKSSIFFQGFRAQVFGLKAKDFLTGKLSLRFDEEKKEFKFEGDD